MSDSTPAALYRRYRPRTLRKLVGQEMVVTTLTSALANDRVGHAYLFSGPRGTGKTSTARILARALNCESPLELEPCNTCGTCVAITDGVSFDVVELDAATNNGVDAMRELIASTALASSGRKRVFIVDEVHMLSKSASDAFLKTLEEPPSHVVFVLATTDPQKVGPTVRSRTQHLEFKLVRPEVMHAHLTRVAAHAGLECSPEVITEAVRRGGGSVRDALSALDVLAASGVEDPQAPAQALLHAVARADVLEMLKAVAAATQDGLDARTLAEEALSQLRECFLVQMGAEELLTSASAGRGELLELLDARTTVLAMEHIGEAISAMRAEHDRRVNLEVQLSRFARAAKP